MLLVGGVLPGGGVCSRVGGCVCSQGGGAWLGGLFRGGVTPPKKFLIFFFDFFLNFFLNFFFDFFFLLSLGTPPPPPCQKQTQAYGQRAAGTHPTGMHSCSFCGHVFT